MLLSSGALIGPYRVVAPLGQGGMGEVYRARDSRLNRDVAIKVLPQAVSADVERLARFTREAQTLAALNHPNIAAIYGVEENGGLRALVMELVSGDDLSAIIARGPIPLAEALPIARQIAEALEAAHEQGIVHRDLKPGNVKVRDDGTVKVLDFGLAKALTADGAAVSPDAVSSPTITTPAMTRAGMILGTAAYMAPEQARGRSVDKRADIWAFGVVLYEMLTGTRMFEGESVAETLGLIFAREPDLTALPAPTPVSVRSVLARCLVKDPRQRLRDIGEARCQIEDAIAGKSAPPSSAPVAAASGPAVRWPAWLIVPVAALIAAAGGWLARPVSPVPRLRMSMALPPGEQITTAPAISSNGRLVAYAAGRTAATSQLYLRAIDDFVARPVVGSVGAQYPFFSPEGKTIAFFAGGKLRRASVAGGASTDIASSATPWGGTWDTRGRIVYTTGLGSGLWRVSEDGGTPERLTEPDGADAGYAHVFPQRVAGTDDVLFAFWGRSFYGALLSAESRTWREVTPLARSSLSLIYSASGHLLSNDGAGVVVAARWQRSSPAAVRLETPVLENVNWTIGTERSWIDVSDSGATVFVPGNPSDRHLAWIDRQGRVTQIAGGVGPLNQATLSRDGRRVAFGAMNSQWIVDLVTGARSRIVSDVRSWHGGWLPGDERIALSSNHGGDWDLYTVAAGGGELTPLLVRPFAQHVQTIADNGTIVFLERHPTTGSDLWLLTAGGRTTPLLTTPFNEESASLSADGRYVAYVSDESGRKEVYAMPIGGGGSRVAVSIDGGTGPVWSRDGKELFYRAGDDLLSAEIRTAAPLAVGRRSRLLDLSAFDPGYFHEFDVSADGQRFLFIQTPPRSRPVRLDFILNWFDELTAKMP